jgi:adenylylsulfate kinase
MPSSGGVTILQALGMLENFDLKSLGVNSKEAVHLIAEATKLFVGCGMITICCFISPTDEIRSIAKKIIGEADFVEVFVNTPIEVCEKRDVKGLYAKARRGEIKEFTGIDAPFEKPANPTIEITETLSIDDCVKKILAKLNL